MPPEAVRERALSIAPPAYVYDLTGLRTHAASVRAAVPAELYYAAKANPDAHVLATLAPYVDGFEVSSGGELAHVREVLPEARLAFGGPGKTDAELAAAFAEPASVHRIHVESPLELRRLAALGRAADVLLRLNLPVAAAGASLRMSGPFGMDAEALGACLDLLARTPSLRLRGMHAHLASGLEAGALLDVAAQVLGWARSWIDGLDGGAEINLGGGMAVDYRDPERRFDWAAYGAGLAALRRPGERLRVEPGRAITAYCGWYVTDVLDLKRTHGSWYAVLRGGTHHLRTPVAKGHDQPFTVLPAGDGPATGGPVTLVGQLCTPKDVLARNVPVERIAVGDVVVFAMAGAYAWNISHHDFLMHPKPSVHYVDGISPAGSVRAAR
jgi:diaminopimelate decarboxylase